MGAAAEEHTSNVIYNTYVERHIGGIDDALQSNEWCVRLSECVCVLFVPHTFQNVNQTLLA